MVNKIDYWDDLVERTQSKVLKRLQYIVGFLESDFSSPRGARERMNDALSKVGLNVSSATISNDLKQLRVVLNYFSGPDEVKTHIRGKVEEKFWTTTLLRNLLEVGIVSLADLKIEEIIAILKENNQSSNGRRNLPVKSSVRSMSLTRRKQISQSPGNVRGGRLVSIL